YRENESIPWERVHHLPDFAYFNHSIHVQKGFGCSTCHGRVDQMPLTWQTGSLLMEWCLDCHRHPEHYVRPREQVFNMEWEPPKNQAAIGRQLVRDYQIRSLQSCSTCHR
ncbi:MAG TPA: cytochrome c3 family protein, partial [Gemmataceae bacterium]|nr:cytochrome c3 family protein [Gemmataceae bacterium]